MSEANSAYYGPAAYRAEAIPPLPAPPRKRERLGEDLLPFGDYAGIDPVQQDSAEFVQDEDQRDPEFFESDDWWWDHQRIRFLKSQIGLSIVLMAFPFFYLCVFVGMSFLLASGVADLIHDNRPALATLAFTVVFGGIFGTSLSVGQHIDSLSGKSCTVTTACTKLGFGAYAGTGVDISGAMNDEAMKTGVTETWGPFIRGGTGIGAGASLNFGEESMGGAKGFVGPSVGGAAGIQFCRISTLCEERSK